jgi:hypothetical protein
LDSESASEKEEADEDAKVAVGLVATETSEADPDSDSENEVYSKIPKEELIESLKELLTHFELRTNELKDLNKKYVVLMKQQESTLYIYTLIPQYYTIIKIQLSLGKNTREPLLPTITLNSLVITCIIRPHHILSIQIIFQKHSPRNHFPKVMVF